MSDWNFADVWEAVADVLPDADALVHGERVTTWRAFDERADAVARWLLARGVEQQDKVALYLYNCSEYLEATFGILKIGLAPVNTNYRYADDELAYLWENADAVCVVFHGAFADHVDEVRERVPGVRCWLWVDDGSGPCPTWATPYEDVATGAAEGAGGTERAVAPWGRSGDDVYMLYTGGTTGMPKGVMWRQDDLFARMNANGFRPFDMAAGIEGIRRALSEHGPGMTLMPACPLMHGTGAFTSLECLAEGGRVVTLTERHFDPVELLETVGRQKVNGLVIVGDAFGRPILATLDEHEGHYDLSSLVGIVSSGVMWSEEVKRGLLRHHPQMLLVDAFSSSEALGMGTSVSSGASTTHTGRFTLGPEVRVLDEEGRDVEPGSGQIGVLALGGRNPLGYYKDQAKTDATFRTYGGVRYSIPGDYAQVEADGTIRLLGRGSVCINTGGEKVYPEEVEEALKTMSQVSDAVVVGIPNERFGEEIVAVLETTGAITEEEAISHVKGKLASYKAPRRVRFAPIGRSPAGKVDYGRHRREATEWAGTSG